MARHKKNAVSSQLSAVSFKHNWSDLMFRRYQKAPLRGYLAFIIPPQAEAWGFGIIAALRAGKIAVLEVGESDNGDVGGSKPTFDI